jgi:hypothetical protein
MALHQHKDESILDQYDLDFLKLKYNYLAEKISEATVLVEKQLALIKANNRRLEDVAATLKTVHDNVKSVK